MDFPWSPSKKIYEKLGLLIVLGGRWNTDVSSLHHHQCVHFLVFVCFQHFVTYNVFFEKVYMYNGIHTFLIQSMWSFFTGEISWFKKLSIDSNLTLFCPLLQLCSSESLYNIKFSATFFEYMYLTYRLSETIR